MTVFKALVPMKDGLYQMSVVEYQGMFWLVPTWLDLPRKGWSKPARIVCLSLVPHTHNPQDPDCQFFGYSENGVDSKNSSRLS